MTEDYEEGHGIPQSAIDQAKPSVPEECHLLTNKPAMTLKEQAVESAGIILHAAGSSLRNYTPRAKDEILACTRHALTEAYARGRRDGLDSQAQDDGLRNRIIELEARNARLENAIKIQANAVKTLRNCEAQIAAHRLRRAEQIMHECDPANVESEKEMNAILTEENARLTAQVAAGDVLREAAQRVINSVSPCTHAERAALSSLYKQITAYDTAKENLND